MLSKRKFLTPAEVAAHTQVALATVYREMQRFTDTLGDEGLGFVYVRKQKRISRQDLKQWMDSGRVRAMGQPQQSRLPLPPAK
jgi:deoxyribodipyrimidine photolyase-like uncharacterized protein